MRPSVLSLIAATAAAALLSAEPSDRVDHAGIRQAVERSLPLLQSSAATWFEKRECASCHHQTLGLVAMTVARERGVAVDEAVVKAQLEKTLRTRTGWHEPFVTGDVSINEAIGQSYRAVGVGTAGGTPTAMTDAVSYLLAGRQHVSGRWPSYSRRPPLEDSEFTATAFSIRTLRLYPLRGREAEFDERVARAARWLEATHPADTEDRAMQLLGLGWAGTPATALARHAEALLAEQRADGGWAQIATRPSDAYATGLAIVALNQTARVSFEDRRLRRALRYLIDTQQADGSWHVPTRRTTSEGLPYFETGYPHGKDQFISYAGAAWSATALALALGEDGPSAALIGTPPARMPASFDTGAPDGLTPLMRAALYGTVADIDLLLASGAEVNAASPTGVTALMCAVHDSRKFARLLAAGADPSATTASGHSTLMIAAGYADARDAAMTLLARGVPVGGAVTKGVLEGVTASSRALTSGQLDVAERLLAAGASVEARGATGLSPLVIAVWHGDVPMVEWLLARGAKVDGVSSNGFGTGYTPLLAAIEDGRAEVVKVLLASGADVARVDEEGRSAVVYAAVSIDRGTTAIVDMLLAAGARPTPVPPAPDAPAVLARTWGKPHIAERLERP